MCWCSPALGGALWFGVFPSPDHEDGLRVSACKKTCRPLLSAFMDMMIGLHSSMKYPNVQRKKRKIIQ